MFTAIKIALLLTSHAALAAPAPLAAPGKILLRCSISSGPDQEVSVWENDGQLSLHELTSAGSRIQRPLSAAEWSSRRLRLRREMATDENILTGENGAWTYLGQGAGINYVVLADCW